MSDLTKEEAIKVLYGIRNLNYREWWDEECDEAIDIAIEALSSETEPKWNCTANFVAEQLDRLRNMTDEERLDFLIRFFSPSADAEWIKVTEDTPPDYPCLVCDANGNQPFVPMGIVTITDEEHGEWHIDGRLWDSPKVFVDGEWGNQISYGNRIVAWMPLPTPYKGGDDE